ncbi:hypothetical protein GCM10022236_21440 [Microlunatus ginsengisoli]|uniref:Uncharacterized protein n=1 Tax=Microlunatus ginsengisoli TaxID=363863 RepID=A0ABP6ZZ01_9ACTN
MAKTASLKNAIRSVDEPLAISVKKRDRVPVMGRSLSGDAGVIEEPATRAWRVGGGAASARSRGEPPGGLHPRVEARPLDPQQGGCLGRKDMPRVGP